MTRGLQSVPTDEEEQGTWSGQVQKEEGNAVHFPWLSLLYKPASWSSRDFGNYSFPSFLTEAQVAEQRHRSTSSG